MQYRDLASLLAALKSGECTIDAAATALPGLLVRPEPKKGDPMAQMTEDGDPFEPGTFDDVSAAYARGELTNAQYATLAEAAAQ